MWCENFACGRRDYACDQTNTRFISPVLICYVNKSKFVFIVLRKVKF